MTPYRSAPSATVVMPVRNEEASITAALDSVLHQTLSDIEVVVVDGASTDGTVAKVQEVACQEPRVRLVHNPHRTIPHALNIGLAQARGEFLTRVDAHAHISVDYVERGVRALLNDEGLAAVGGQRIGVGGSPVGDAVAAVLSSRFGVGDSINHYASQAQDSDHASFGVYRIEVLRAVRGWDEGLLVNEDVDLDYRILNEGWRIRYDPEMHIYWQVRQSLPDFARQYRRYGRGKAAMVRKNGLGAVRPRHLVPPALLGCLTAAAALAASGRVAVGAALAAPYVIALSAASFQLSVNQEGGKDLDPLVVAGAFGSMHVSWGWGFIEGLLLGAQPVASSAREVEFPAGA